MINQIKPGYRVAFRANGHSITRTAVQVGDDYVVVQHHNKLVKVPAFKITSFVPGSWGTGTKEAEK